MVSSLNTTNSSTSSSGTLQFSGLSSGVDFQASIDAIMTARRASTVDPINSTITANADKITAIGELKTLSANMATALNQLRGSSSTSDPNVFRDKLAFLSSASASGAPSGHEAPDASTLLGVTTTTGAQAATHTVTVQQLATSHQVRGDSFDSISGDITSATTPTVTAGTFTLNSETITVGAGDTLLDVRDKINASSANVTATVVSASDSSHYLVLTADDSGTANQMTISNTATSQDLGLVNAGDGSIKNELDAGQDSIIDVNGITGITRSSNTVDDVIEGLTLSLFSVEADTEVTITVEDDLNGIKTAISSFIDGYNALRDFQVEQRTASDRDEDGEEDDFGPLAFDTTLRQIMDKLNSIVAAEVPGLTDGYSSLGQIGIVINDDFQLEMDETIFDAKILADVDEVERLFAFDFSTSDSRLVHISHTSDTTYTVDGSNVVEPYYIDITGTDGSGNVNGADADTTTGTTGVVFDVSGKVITMSQDTSGLNGMKLLFNGAASLGAVSDIEISFTRGVADQIYYFFE